MKDELTLKEALGSDCLRDFITQEEKGLTCKVENTHLIIFDYRGWEPTKKAGA